MIDHDFGLAPNPFGQYCTIAVCKPNLRKSKNLKIGDWIIGTGSKSLEKSSGIKSVSKLIYAMKLTEIIKLNELWWHEICNGSRRDQLSFDYCCWKLGIKYKHMDGNMYQNEHFRYRAHNHYKKWGQQ